MKSPIPSSLALITSLALLLTACGSEDSGQSSASGKSSPAAAKTAVPADTELANFLGLHKQFCESEFKTRDALAQALESDKRFNAAQGYKGVYETNIAGVSYAVSPEVDGCTTDVLVQDATTGELLFSYEQINQALISKGYTIVGEETSRKDMGRDQNEIKILEKTFLSPSNEVTNLDYPAERKDQYYMTLFVKKFEADEVTEEISMNN
ncbi:hypothetical protein EOL70_15310 [Leucothrix sargassi]|nr:hypothetical protein EOL70_15310 [Leucothrix sargassi]